MVNDDAALAKYSAAPTTSSAWPPRFNAIELAARLAKASMSQALEMSVRKGPHMMLLTRTFGPNAKANERVRLFRPALAAP